MQATYLTTQLRESAPYVSEAGWHQTAQLLLAAAEEIERLRARSSGAKSENHQCVLNEPAAPPSVAIFPKLDAAGGN